MLPEGGATEHQGEIAGDGPGADPLLDLLGGQVAILEIRIQRVLGGLGDRLEQLLAVFGGSFDQLGGNVGGVPMLPVVATSGGRPSLTTRSTTPVKSASDPIRLEHEGRAPNRSMIDWTSK